MCKYHFIIFTEMAKPADSVHKKSLPSLVFLSFGIFLLHSVNEVIMERQRRHFQQHQNGGNARSQQLKRNGRSDKDQYTTNDALESLLHEKSDFVQQLVSSISSNNGQVISCSLALSSLPNDNSCQNSNRSANTIYYQFLPSSGIPSSWSHANVL